MNGIIQTLLNSLDSLGPSERVGWALLQSLWEIAAVAVMLALVLAALRRRSAQARYVAACSALGLTVTLSLITAALAIAPIMKSQGTSAHARMAGHVGAIRIEPLVAPQDAALPEAPAAGHALSLSRPALRAMSYAWITGVMLLSAWNVFGWVGVQRLRRRASLAPVAWQQRLDALAAAMKVTRHVAMRVCAAVPAPAVLGWLRPVVLVPASTLAELPVGQIEALLLHELAHVRRCDYLVNLIQTVIETIFFYHPAAWWIGARIRQERESCCDDIAARHVGSPLAYAKALAAMAGLRSTMTPALALGSDGGSLRLRIERLLNAQPIGRRGARRVSPIPAAAVVLAALLGLLLTGGRRAANGDAENLGPSPVARATQPPTTASSITPEDLKGDDSGDFTIGPQDLIAVSISELNGPKSETVKQARVTQRGNMSLPLLDQPIHAAGLTEMQLEQAIIKAYRDAALIAKANVSVTILEPRSRTFDVVGAVARPGEYLLKEQDLRLLGAIATAGGTEGDVAAIRVMRKANAMAPARTIEVDASKLLAGDIGQNMVVRPGDTVLVTGGGGATGRPAPMHFVRVIVGPDSLAFQGTRVSIEQLATCSRSCRITVIPSSNWPPIRIR